MRMQRRVSVEGHSLADVWFVLHSLNMSPRCLHMPPTKHLRDFSAIWATTSPQDAVSLTIETARLYSEAYNTKMSGSQNTTSRKNPANQSREIVLFQLSTDLWRTQAFSLAQSKQMLSIPAHFSLCASRTLLPPHSLALPLRLSRVSSEPHRFCILTP
jgi:hypothetical protein